jgi:hypothetical protein
VNDAGSARPSGELRRSIDDSRPSTSNGIDAKATAAAPDVQAQDVGGEKVKEERNGVANGSIPAVGPLLSSRLPINPARISIDSSRPSLDLVRDTASSRPSLDSTRDPAPSSRDAAELQAQIEVMERDHAAAETLRQEEMHMYLERIDALQAKLTYLAKETVAAAKEANASSANSTLDRQVAEKDERIALLMEEGEKLSKSEMRHLQTIKKLRAKNTEDDKATAELKRKVERSERAEADLKIRLRRSEQAERAASDKVKSISVIERQVEELREDRENAAELVRSLTIQLGEAKERAGKAEKDFAAAEVDKNLIAHLQNDLEDAQIERRLAEDRAAAELRKAREEGTQLKERSIAQAAELRNEIATLESRLEATRARAEEASASSTGAGGEGESTVKLMRQVEVLQQQYALAKGNWETIETSLNARLVALEKERDEATRREAEVRKKAREAAAQSRRFEEGLETSAEQVKGLERELRAKAEQVASLEARLEREDADRTDIQAELDRQQQVWQADLARRLEEEKQKWRREMGGFSPSLRNESPTFSRKASGAFEGSSLYIRRPAGRLPSQDFSASPQRRSSAIPSSGLTRTQTETSDHEPRQPSEPSSIPPTPSIEVDSQQLLEDFEDVASPQPTIGDFFSTSTTGPGVGPSVQLVERMSALVRKLEAEKASFKDELGRLGTQRDEARTQVVELMREVETKRSQESAVTRLETELRALQQRHDASLEMLGEREEEVAELKMDVKELKTIYRELVETKVAGVSAS